MARDLSPVLHEVQFSRVLTSPRLRARATCALAGLGAMAQTEPDLAEWDYGAYEGLRTAQIWERHPHWDVWRDGCPGGESPAQVSARADRLIGRLCELCGNVALFSHGQFGCVLAARWIGLSGEQGQHFALHPASISILDFEANHPKRPLISLWNSSAAWSRPGG
jgi:probable phosphoglycerate mutase